MSGVITPVFAQDLLLMMFNRGYNPAYTQVEVALSTKVPVSNADSSQLFEPVGGGYRRSVPTSLSSGVWGLTGAGEIANVQGISWPQACTVDWGAIVGWALVGSNTTGVLAVGELALPTYFTPPMQPYLPAYSVSFGLYEVA